jgi:dTDP-4-dehydrorhamnose reductase
MKRTILVTGRSGQVGFELSQTLASLGTVTAVGRGELDLSNPDGVRRYIRSVRPDIIVNAAAYTDVNSAESNRQLALVVNGESPGVLAEELNRYGGRVLIHYSTDYVFDGAKTSPYIESDPPAPVNAYGQSKLAGERAIQETGAPHVILRTSWVYATRGTNFLLTILRLARSGRPLRIIADQVGAPTWARSLADTTGAILLHLLQTSGTDMVRVSGTYHVSAGGQTSWHGFAETILEESLQRLRARRQPSAWCEDALINLQATTSSEYPTPARRPAYSLLSNAKIANRFGICLSGWRDQLQHALDEYDFSPRS